MYLQKLKEDLPLNDIILLLDSAENYSFVCQDNYRSLCIISNERNHGAHTVHAFITRIIKQIKQIIPNVVKIHYFR